MNRNWLCIALMCFTTALAAGAQEAPRSEVSVVGSGFFTKGSNNGALSQNASEAGGVLVGYRYNFNRWLGAEANYGFSRNTQGFVGSFGNTAIQSNVHVATGDLVVKLPIFGRWRPYALAGAGALMFDPTDAGKAAVAGAGLQARAAFLYGGGVDFGLTHHIALRGEYRGYVYRAPDFGVASLNTGAMTHLAQPSAGIVFRF